MKKVILEYGESAFSFLVIEEVATKEESTIREIYWIDKKDSFKNGYNLTTGGDGGNTYSKLSKDKMEEISKKISESKMGDNNPIRKNPSLVRGENNGMYGKIPHNIQSITIMSISDGKEYTFDSNTQCADFMGYKNSTTISAWKKNPQAIKKGYRLVSY